MVVILETTGCPTHHFAAPASCRTNARRTPVYLGSLAARATREWNTSKWPSSGRFLELLLLLCPIRIGAKRRWTHRNQ